MLAVHHSVQKPFLAHGWAFALRAHVNDLGRDLLEPEILTSGHTVAVVEANCTCRG